jgi:CRP-like cAMP-binding protein
VTRNEGLFADVQSIALGTDDDLADVAAHALRAQEAARESEERMGLTVIEKVLKLRGVDVLRRATSEDLAYVAQIAEETELDEGTKVYAEGDAPDALHVVITGGVQLTQGSTDIGRLGPGEAFGAWALVDESPRLATAVTTAPTTLLTVRRDDFRDLLSDRPAIVQAVFRAMVEHIRHLADLAKGA